MRIKLEWKKVRSITGIFKFRIFSNLENTRFFAEVENAEKFLLKSLPESCKQEI